MTCSQTGVEPTSDFQFDILPTMVGPSEKPTTYESQSGITETMSFTGEPPASGQELVDESPFSARCRDVRANRSAVDVVMSALGRGLGESDCHALPDARGTPAPEAPIDRVPVALFLRDIAPRRTRAQPPQDAIDDVSVVLGRPTPPAFAGFAFNRQQHLQDTPLDPRQIAAAQGCLLESAALNQNEIHASMILCTPPSLELERIPFTCEHSPHDTRNFCILAG